MKKRIILFGTMLMVLMLLVGTISTVSAQPTLEEEIENAIALGLNWLKEQQQPDGGWGPVSSCERVAYTGLAVLKFETYALENGIDPLDMDYEYYDQVLGGLNYIMANKHPGSDFGGTGSYFTACTYVSHQIYNTGVAMMALASSYHPETYSDPLQEAVAFMVWAQADEEECGVASTNPHFGGWRYTPNQCNSDNSNTGYATLGLGFAAAPPPFGFGLEIPQQTKDQLDVWIDVIQDDIDGDPWDGGSWYDPYSSWVNILKTGNLIYEMGLVGDTVETGRLQDAVNYIERHWNDPQSCGGNGGGWLNEYQAMFTMMKGFEGLGIQYLNLDGGAEPDDEWFPIVAEHIVDTQNVDGSWPWDCWGNELLTTTWALLTLERSVPSFDIPVPVDIKPSSCPNPMNHKANGVLPVAIVGTADFDATQVDPATVRLKFDLGTEGIAPLSWGNDHAAIPYEPYLDKDLNPYACIRYRNFDEYLDFGMRFSIPEVVEMLGNYEEEAVRLYVTGNLLEEFGGAPFIGEDIVWLIANK